MLKEIIPSLAHPSPRTGNRTIAVCTVNGTDIGVGMVKQGFALDRLKFFKGKYD